MHSAHSTMFYGVFVKCYSLCFAADAHHAVQTTLLALDMIKLRRRTGNLSTSMSSSAVVRIPDEVWQLIKEQVVDQATLDAEKEELEPYVGGCSTCSPPPSLPTRFDSDSAKEAFHFWEVFIEGGGTQGMMEYRSTEIENLLRSFGLTQPLASPYGLHYSQELTLDFERLISISLPLYSTFSTPSPPSASSTANSASTPSFPRSTTEDHSTEDNNLSHSVVRFSHSTFDLPPDANLRLKRFLSLFNLKAENPTGPTFHSSPSVPPSAPEKVKSEEYKGQIGMKIGEKEKEDHEKVCCSQPAVEPHWHIVTTFEGNVW